jgi:hypothetical protein
VQDGVAGDGDSTRRRLPASSERTCAVTREVLPPERLLRFVAGPDGLIVPDLRRRLPGRGVWVTAMRRHVEEAVRSKIFSRSLRRQAKVPPTLAGDVEALLERAVVDLLALANKAGLVTGGFERIDGALSEGRVAVLLHASDAAADGAGKLDRKAQALSRAAGRATLITRPLTVDQMSLALGRANVVHAALSEGGLTAKFCIAVERLACYRDGNAAHERNSPTGGAGSADGVAQVKNERA